MKKFLLLIILGACFGQAYSQCQHRHCQKMKQMLRGGSALSDPGNLRSDTLDVLNYSITLDMTEMNSQQISAACEIHFKSRMDDISWINLDLLALTVDSVVGDVPLTFSQGGEQLHVVLPLALDTDEEYSITVYYQGSPEGDALWGGFYFSSGYAFNLGVGFVANPHTFGRAWFPCFDNFVERSSYDFHVLTNNNRTTYCNGMRTGVEIVGQDSLLTHWELTEQIPSYLASVAVTNYVHAESSFESISGDDIPIYLTAKSVDTTEMKQSLINLVPWLEGAEQHYGPYRWSRVGYCAVPFNGGAMEHATNISYPLFAVDGSLVYETLYAHELAHHWWGDMITCRNAYDMWINEGWAAYSEALFQEVIYGPQAYIDYVRDNHKDVLLNAHERDGDRYPVSGIPHEITYGDHVYNKGAMVAHTLRGYMGDEDFFTAIQAFMEEYQFSDVSSEDLRDFFSGYTDADLASYFDNWIFAKGFPEFRVRSFSGSGTTWEVEVEQHVHYAPQLYTNVPMQLNAVNAQGEVMSSPVVLSAENSLVDMELPEDFLPVAFYLNRNDAITMAVLAEERWLTDTGNNDFDFAEAELDINSLGGVDSLFMRIENHWAAVDENQAQVEYYISPDRWWNVITNAGEMADMEATLRYYGDPDANNYYDSLFFSYIVDHDLTEDDLVLLYRPDGSSNWQPWATYELVTAPGGNDNWSGRIEIAGLQAGQYAWAVATGVDAVEVIPSMQAQVFAAPGHVVIRTGKRNCTTDIFDNSGHLVYSGKFSETAEISSAAWSQGIYLVKVSDRAGQYSVHRVVVR